MATTRDTYRAARRALRCARSAHDVAGYVACVTLLRTITKQWDIGDPVVSRFTIKQTSSGNSVLVWSGPYLSGRRAMRAWPR